MDVSIKQSITERFGDLDFICRATAFKVLTAAAARCRLNSLLILCFNLILSGILRRLQITNYGYLLLNYADDLE